MATKPWKSSAASRPPDSITGAAKRYHACAYAFATTLGIPLAEALRDYHGPITAIYIEVCRGDLRLPTTVTLPKLAAEPARVVLASVRDVEHAAEPPANPGNAGDAEGARSAETPVNPGPEEFSANMAKNSKGGRKPKPDSHAPPTTIPAGLPCAGQAVGDLTPPQLRMLLSKVDQLAAEQGSRWRPLLDALAAERAARVAQGQRPTPTPVAANGPGA